jgi:hypothetical protein
VDGIDFDVLIRSFVTATTRRETARGVAGVALAALLGRLGPADAGAEFPKKCKKNAQCGPGARCVGARDDKPGKCKCKSGLVSCAGTKGCVDTEADPNHCGGCADQGGAACTGGRTCQTGQCACPTGQTVCGETCVDTNTDEDHCGGCAGEGGTACTGGKTCQSGECTCPGSTTECAGTCVDTSSDENNCGGCAGAGGEICSFSLICREGECACERGFVCGGSIPQCGSDSFGPCLCTHTIDGTMECKSNACDLDFPCATSQQCVDRYGDGAICQAPGTGCCGQRCVVPCGFVEETAARTRAGMTSNVKKRARR